MSVFSQSGEQINKVTAHDRSTGDLFGWSVAIDGNWAVIGSYLNESDENNSNPLNAAGAAYIFKKDSHGNWKQYQKIVASDRELGDYFGYSVDLDNGYIVVGSIYEAHDENGSNEKINAGSAYIYKLESNNEWVQKDKIVASDRSSTDNFGWSVAIDGNYVVVGVPIEDEDENGGNSKSNSGSAYIFKRNEENWSQVQKIVASDRDAIDYFGWTVAMDGDHLLVGAYSEDEDEVGGNSLSDAGSVYAFKRSGSLWNEEQKIVPVDRGASDFFGYTVDIIGDLAVVGAHQEDHDTTGGDQKDEAGAAYVFQNNGTSWVEVQKLVASDREAEDFFGRAVAIDDNVIIVGAEEEDHNELGLSNKASAGSAYVFEREMQGWNQVQKIVASDRDALDKFGRAVSISGNNILVGAYQEDSDVSGNNFLSESGSAYFFRDCKPKQANVNITSCENYISPSGKYFDEEGLYFDTIQTTLHCDSLLTINLTLDSNQYQSIIDSSCNSYSSPSGKLWITSGIYMDTILSQTKCDSIITIDLFMENLDTSISVSGDTLMVNESNAIYQWINCDGNIEIAGAINQTYFVTNDGEYAVRVSKNGCEVTSGCISIVNDPAYVDNQLFEGFQIYPNPVRDKLIVEQPASSADKFIVYSSELRILSLIGKVILKETINYKLEIVNLSELRSGMYFIEIGNQRQRFLKL